MHTRAHIGTRGLWQQLALPYVVLWAALVVHSLLFVHVQIVTRLFTSLPPLHWAVAEAVATRPRLARVWLAFAITYAAVTALLFANFYPPA
jgi:GPI mannosyltransferase 2